MMARFGSILGLICTMALHVAIASGPSAAGEASITHPLVIICDLKGIRYLLYLDRIAADGTATYMTPSNVVITAAADGVLSRGGEVAVGGNCTGKTLEELRAAGQTLSVKE